MRVSDFSVWRAGRRYFAPAAFLTMSAHTDFRSRHLGAIGSDREEMLRSIGYALLDDLADAAVPAGIRLERELELPPVKTENSHRE